MTTVRACIYFDSDQSVTVLPKSRCILRGPFIEGAEVEVDWRGENGEKQRHIGLIITTRGKGNHYNHIFKSYFGEYQSTFRLGIILFAILDIQFKYYINMLHAFDQSKF